jgi:cholesterol transport system auxiliary component
MKGRSFAFFSIFVTLTSITGCAVNLNINKYALNNICIRQHCNASCYTLFVAEPTAQPGYDTDQIIYLKCPYQLQAYSRNSWASPPHEMLATLIAQSLRNTCFFKAVVLAPFVGESQYRLETRLLKLQQEFFCNPSRVRMILHAVVINNKCHQAIGEKVFEVVVIAPENGPYGGVIAANRATQIILANMTDFVIRKIQCCPIIQHEASPTVAEEGDNKTSCSGTK